MASDLPPSDTVDRLEHAEQLKWEGKHAEAIAILEQLVLEDPENTAALEEIADNELSLGHIARSEAAAKRAIALDAESYTGHYILGFLHSRKERWAEAIVELRSANAHKSNNSEILRCLGWALFMGGQRAQGVVTLERALNLDDQSVLILCDLGVAYLQLQSYAKARALFLRVLDIEPGNARAKECLALTERMQKGVVLSQQKRGMVKA